MDISRSRYLRKELEAERIDLMELAEIEDAFAAIPDEHLRDLRANAMAEDMLDEIDAHRERRADRNARYNAMQTGTYKAGE